MTKSQTGRGNKSPDPGLALSDKAKSAYRKLATNRERLDEYYESTDDVPSQGEFIRFCGADNVIATKHGNDIVDWYTPAKYIEACRATMGGIDLDPASSEWAQKTVGHLPRNRVNQKSDRQRFVSRAEVDAMLEYCPDHHWQTIIALSRYGGLRTPSETLSLRWQDINWAANRIVVQSPKTKRHGKPTRTIPLFPELREHLDTSFELAPEGAVYVVDERFRKALKPADGWANCNLRTTFVKIIERAGLAQWPRLFHNLRASRETELVEQFPLQVVAAWLGNTPTVALKHYLMVTNEHFAEAVSGDTQEATQKATQHTHAGGRSEPQAKSAEPKKPRELLEFAPKREAVPNAGMEDRGLEPYAFSNGKAQVGDLSGAESGAVGVPIDPLTAWLDACPVTLDDAQQEAIRAIVAK